MSMFRQLLRPFCKHNHRIHSYQAKRKRLHIKNRWRTAYDIIETDECKICNKRMHTWIIHRNVNQRQAQLFIQLNKRKHY